MKFQGAKPGPYNGAPMALISEVVAPLFWTAIDPAAMQYTYPRPQPNAHFTGTFNCTFQFTEDSTKKQPLAQPLPSKESVPGFSIDIVEPGSDSAEPKLWFEQGDSSIPLETSKVDIPPTDCSGDDAQGCPEVGDSSFVEEENDQAGLFMDKIQTGPSLQTGESSTHPATDADVDTQQSTAVVETSVAVSPDEGANSVRGDESPSPLVNETKEGQDVSSEDLIDQLGCQESQDNAGSALCANDPLSQSSNDAKEGQDAQSEETKETQPSVQHTFVPSEKASQLQEDNDLTPELSSGSDPTVALSACQTSAQVNLSEVEAAF